MRKFIALLIITSNNTHNNKEVKFGVTNGGHWRIKKGGGGLGGGDRLHFRLGAKSNALKF